MLAWVPVDMDYLKWSFLLIRKTSQVCPLVTESIRNYCVSVDESQARALFPRNLQTREHLQQIALRIQRGRKNSIQGGGQSFHFSKLLNNGGIKPMSLPVDLASLDVDYAASLQCDLQSCWLTVPTADVCTLAGELAFLQPVQSIVKQHISEELGGACS